MKARWTPDDSFLNRKRAVGLKRLTDVLPNNKGFDRIVTSRDPGMDQLRYALRREGMPPGWETWQLPVHLLESPTFFFLTSSAPGAVLPEHSHSVDQLRVVLSGGLIYNGVELKTGDWMYVPKGKSYGLSASLNPGCVHMYAY